MILAKALSADQRADALQRMSGEELDVLVVGGGIVGVGAALDAVTRGLTVGLIEQRDLASGTSSRSSKLVHGGLRYLEMLDFALVKEALEERGLLLTRLAPHLVTPQPFLYPLRKGYERAYVGAGLALYDALAVAGSYDKGVPRHRHIFKKKLARMAPDLRLDDLHGAIRYYDAQVDDARLVMTVARTAASYGAHVATRTQVTGFLREGDPSAGSGQRRVVGVTARDLERGVDLEVRARSVINAAGVWTDQIQEMMGGEGAMEVDASKGIHLVVPRDRIRCETGLISKTSTSVLFVIPWRRFWIIGTTDTPWDLDLAHPAASRRDIDYLLEHVNQILKDPLDHEDVVGVYAGLRPLLKATSKQPGEGETAKISREHTTLSPVPGLVLIAGGKLTTYRVMGRDAVDLAVRDLGEGGPQVGASITDRVPLVGASGHETRSNQRVALSRAAGLDIGWIDHLLGRYGGLVDEVLTLVAQRPELGEPLEGAGDYLAAEVVYAVAAEGARHLDDVLARRTRISIETDDRGTLAARPAADLMATELGWDTARTDDEVDHWLRRVEAERLSQLQATDQEADEARVSAPDIV